MPNFRSDGEALLAGGLVGHLGNTQTVTPLTNEEGFTREFLLEFDFMDRTVTAKLEIKSLETDAASRPF